MGVDPVSIIIIGIALSALAMQMQKGGGSETHTSGPVKDTSPPQLSTRGQYVPYLVGRRRVGPMIGWVGDRETDEKVVGGGGGGGGGGKGGGGGGGISTPEQVQLLYSENAWHVINCNGPADKLLGIYENGKRIWEGPITSKSHPSGSTIDAGEAGEFTIYWGEPKQPINSFLSDEDRVGVLSRWPFTCYVQWRPKNLGAQAYWPALTYDLVVKPYATELVGSPCWIEETFTPKEGKVYNIVGVTNGIAGKASFVVEGKANKVFRPGTQAILDGNAATDGYYDIYDSSYNPTTKKTTVILDQTLEGGNVAGTLQGTKITEQGGANPAHVLWQLLFRGAPHGIGCDRALFDMASFEDVGRKLFDEGLAISLFVEDGEKADTAIAWILQDIGAVIGRNPNTGLYQLRLIRKPDIGSIPFIPETSIRAPLPARKKILTRRVGKMIFDYTRKGLRFRPDTVTIPNDESRQVFNYVEPRKSSMPTITGGVIAEAVAERRAQEELGGKDAMSVIAGREARRLTPGEQFVAEGTDRVLLLMGTRPDLLSGNVTLDAMLDSYGVEAADANDVDPGAVEPGSEAVTDPAWTVASVPMFVMGGATVERVFFPRIRANEDILAANLWISDTDNTYKLAISTSVAYAGGTLLDELPENAGKYISEEGPTFTVVGVGVDKVPDLSGDNAAWRRGDLVAILCGGQGFPTEFAYIRSVTAIDATTYRINGLIRARLGSTRRLHEVGTTVYIIERTKIQTCGHKLIVPGAKLFVKSQPVSTGGTLALSEIDPIKQDALEGLGTVPYKPRNLRLDNGPAPLSPVWSPGQSLRFKWTYLSPITPATGAGSFPPGDETSIGDQLGTFTVRLMTTGGIVKKNFTGIQGRSLTVSNSEFKSAFGGSEPTAFLVGVRNKHGGLKSDEVTLKLTRL